MDKKVLNQLQLSIIKRTAQNVNSNFEKLQKVEAKLAALLEERNTLEALVNEMEAPVIRLTGGYKSTDIFERVVTPLTNEDGTPKCDPKTGYQMKQTKYVLRYPDTILPSEPTENFTEESVGDFKQSNSVEETAASDNAVHASEVLY